MRLLDFLLTRKNRPRFSTGSKKQRNQADRQPDCALPRRRALRFMGRARWCLFDTQALSSGRGTVSSILELCRAVTVQFLRSSSFVERSRYSFFDPRACPGGRRLFIDVWLFFSQQLAEAAMQQREIAVLRRAELRTAGSLRKPKTRHQQPTRPLDKLEDRKQTDVQPLRPPGQARGS